MPVRIRDASSTYLPLYIPPTSWSGDAAVLSQVKRLCMLMVQCDTQHAKPARETSHASFKVEQAHSTPPSHQDLATGDDSLRNTAASCIS